MVNSIKILLNLLTKMKLCNLYLIILKRELDNSLQDEQNIRFLNDLIQKLQSELSQFTEEEKELLNKLKPLIEKIEGFDSINTKTSEIIAENSKIFDQCNKLFNLLYSQVIRSWYVLLRMFYHDLEPCKGGARGFKTGIMKADITYFINLLNLTSPFFSPFLVQRENRIYAVLSGKCSRRNSVLNDIQRDIEHTQSLFFNKIQNISLENIEHIAMLIDKLIGYFNELETLKKGEKGEKGEKENYIGIHEIYLRLSEYQKKFEILDKYLEKNAVLVKEMEELSKKFIRIDYDSLFKEAVRRIHSEYLPRNEDIKERFCHSILYPVDKRYRH